MEDLAKQEDAEQIVDVDSPTVRKFIALLEQRILSGHSDADNRSWALTEVGVPSAKYDEMHAILMKAWKLAGLPKDVTVQLRDTARKRYEYLYKMAVGKEKIKEALHALDAMVKLDGLDQPAEGSIEDSVLGGIITNVARAKLAGLMVKARELAERGVPRPAALPPGISGEEEPSNSNGHHKVIDLREVKKS